MHPFSYQRGSDLEDATMRLGAGSPAPPGGGTDPLYDGRPLSPNGYKVELARTLLRRAIMELARP